MDRGVSPIVNLEFLVVLVAIATVYWSSFFWFEGDFCCLSAIGAGCFVHFSWGHAVSAFKSLFHLFIPNL